MAVYGVTTNGFVKKTAETLREELKAAIREKFPAFNLEDDGIHGQILGYQQNAMAQLWDAAAGTYSSFDNAAAEGAQLDRNGKITVIRRGGETNAQVEMACSGTNGTILLAGRLVQRAETIIQFQNPNYATLSNENTVRENITVSNVQNNANYQIQIADSAISVTSSGSATAESIAIQLVNAINADTAILKVNSDFIDAATGKFYIKSNDLISGYKITLDTKLTLDKFWTPIRFLSVDTGDIEAPAGTVNQIITNVAGWTEAINFADGDPGKDIDTDTVYRQRLFTEVDRLGGGTLGAIGARLLLDVANIVSVAGFENDENIIDSAGRPPHCIEMLVEGGDDVDIANILVLYKGGGIKAYGDITQNVLDPYNNLQSIGFSRPEKIYVWFKLTLTKNVDYPADGDTLIKTGIRDTGFANFGIGDTLLIQQFNCPVYQVGGVTNAIIEMAVTSNPLVPPVSYVTTNIALTERQIPFFDEERIEIITV